MGWAHSPNRMKSQKVFTAASFLAISFALFSARSAASEIDGEVFVVMKNGNSIKLALVEVGLHRAETATSQLAETKQRATAMLATAKQNEEAAIKQAHEADIARQVAELRYKNALGNLDRNSSLTTSKRLELFTMMAAGPEFDAILKSEASDTEKLEQLRSLLPILEERIENATVAAAKAAQDSAHAQEELSELESMQFVVKALPPPTEAATTNADGKFRFSGLAPGSYLLAATSSREVGETAERYAWCVPVEVKKLGAVSVMLSNHNLLTPE